MNELCHLCTKEHTDHYGVWPGTDNKWVETVCGLSEEHECVVVALVVDDFLSLMHTRCPACSLILHTSPDRFISTWEELKAIGPVWLDYWG